MTAMMLAMYVTMMQTGIEARDALVERMHDEEGQGAVEYVGIVIVVVALIAALAAFGPKVGKAIGTGLKNVVDNFLP